MGTLVNGKYLVESIYDPTYFEITSPYIFGEEYRSFTGRFESKYQWYDAETHKYLGRYLRMLKDFKHIDLMHLYNYQKQHQYYILGYTQVVFYTLAQFCTGLLPLYCMCHVSKVLQYTLF